MKQDKICGGYFSSSNGNCGSALTTLVKERCKHGIYGGNTHFMKKRKQIERIIND